MSQVFRILIVVLVGFLLPQCSSTVTESKDTPIPEPPFKKASALEKEVLNSSTAFGLKLFKEIIAEQPENENVFISPLSVSLALGMVYNGADNDTRDAMAATLEVVGLTPQQINESYKNLIYALIHADPSVTFEVANSIWYRQGLPVHDDFISTNKEYFDAFVTELDFSLPDAADIINAWVDQNTHGKIPSIVDKPIDPMAVMFLIDAIYFKAIWSNEFDKNNTYDTTFYMANGDETTCQMMYKDTSFTYCEKDLFQAVTLPYGYEFFNMTVFLPKQGVSVDTLLVELCDNWTSWWLGGEVDGELHLPKFKFSWEMELNDVLSALGMGVAFDPLRADFMLILEPGYTNNLYISRVKHKTFVDVNEEGTEAAAVTSVEMFETSMPSSPFVMRVDRPFVFVIWEKETKTPIFMGRVMEPVYD